jgi:hypothetical protein
VPDEFFEAIEGFLNAWRYDLEERRIGEDHDVEGMKVSMIYQVGKQVEKRPGMVM